MDEAPNVELTRTPRFWIAYGVLAALSLLIAWRLFPLAIPVVNLDISLGRAAAIAKAEALAAELGLAPTGAQSAARFSHDTDTQNYIELEGGGKEAFAKLVSGELYSPYWWEVRLFQPGDVNEVVVRFRPDATPIGFSRRLPESYVRDAATKALSDDAARALAEERAKTLWHFDLAPYRLLEQSQQTHPAGRVDHAFVYERPEKIGEARIRLRLVVAGDELVQIAPYVYIPESFDRRFRELRSINDTIAGLASVAAGLLYGLGGCMLGVLWLARKHWLIVRQPLIAGLIVGGLMGAMTLTASPAAWFSFDTAQSTTTFWLREVGAAVAIALGGGLAYALVFMAAESLTRRAFAHQPQLWRVWSDAGGSSSSILGRTIGGYMFVPIELAMIAAFYYATNRWFGWWQPSEVLTDPNILAYSVPALMPIAVSLQAGFMEECLFRAIPLALGALIGGHFGRRNLGIAIAFVLQALVFGAAHANYPGFPAYSRLVELVLPSMLWAAIFLRFGLLPTILLHAVFDLSLFSIPLFLIATPEAWVQRALVIAAALVPLAVVLIRRARAKSWDELPLSLRNGSWVPAAKAPLRSAATHVIVASRAESVVQRMLPFLGLAGLIGWLVFTPMRADVPPLPINREQAVSAADEALKARGVALGSEWRHFAVTRRSGDGQSHVFVWREGGPELYRSFIGTLLAPPLWDVRYAMFEGDVAARAEEWRVTIDPGGSPYQVRHIVPEAKAGARLAKDAALDLAERHVRTRFQIDPATLALIGADEVDRPERKDWTFTFADKRIDAGKDGEARLDVSVAGDEVVGSRRFVHVPEPWERAERTRASRMLVFKMAGALLVALAALVALVAGARSWMRGQCDNRALALVMSISFLSSIMGLAVMWPSIAFSLSTTEPIASQVLLKVLGRLLAFALGSLLIGLAAGVGAFGARTAPRMLLAGPLPAWAAGAVAALVVSGAGAFAGSLTPPDAPLWASLRLESAAFPPFAAAIDGFNTLSSIGIGVFVLYILDRLTATWTRRPALAIGAIVLLFTALIAGKADDPASALTAGIVAGLLAAAIVYCVLRFDARTVPGYIVTAAIINSAENAVLVCTTSGWINFAISAVVSIGIGVAATRYLGRPLPRSDEVPAVAAAH